MAGAMPQGHARALRERKPMSRRAKGLWALSGVIVVIAVVVLIVLSASPAAKRGCISTTLPGIIGAQSLDQCGADARHTCATVEESKAQFGVPGVLIVANACRKGDLPVH